MGPGAPPPPTSSIVLRLLVAALIIALPARAEAPVVFDTAGGETWTFAKPLGGRAEGCAAVELVSPAGRIAAWVAGGRFMAEVPLLAGANRVEALCDGRPAASQEWTVRLSDRPKAWVRARPDGDGFVLDADRSELAEGRPAPLVSHEWHGAAPLGSGERLRLPLPAGDGDHVVTVGVTDGLGRSDEAAALLRVRDGRAVPFDPLADHPAWVDGAVVYGLAPGFLGRHGFADVTARLDEIAALGVTVLWLAPVTEAPEDDFGYAVTDHFALRPSMGTEQEFRALVDGAHARGLKVIIDFVPNHASDRHPYYRDVLARGAASPYHDFFETDPAHYFDWVNLRNLDYDHPEVQRMMIDAFAHWVRRFDVDGFRADVGWGVRERAPEFWRRWRAELTRIKPGLLLLAEASARDGWYFRNGFDAAYDWTDRPGEWAWGPAFEEDGPHPAELRKALAQGADGLVFRFLNNNDTGPRLITRHGPAVARLAATMLLTLPGLPLVYAGDEVGAEFEPYQERPIDWTDRHGLRAHYTRLIALRRALPALTGPGLDLLPAPDPVVAYRRPGPDPVVVALNFSDRPVTLDLSRTGLGRRATDALTGERLRMKKLALPALGARVMTR